MKLVKKLRYKGTLTVLTGLHIGDAKESVEIGGVDLPIVRRRDNKQPYIPGSSLKGKMRCLLEQMEGADVVGRSASINELFGITENKRVKVEGNIPSRLIVRDAYLTPDSAKTLEAMDNLDVPYTEIKMENTIDRIKGSADHPRQQERVPAGAIFEVEFIINVMEKEGGGTNETSADALLKKGIQALEWDYLGGSGSRGYGQVKIELAPAEEQCFA